MKPGKKPFSEKLTPDAKPEICNDPKGRGMMLLPTPLQVADEIKKIRKGKTLLLSELRAKLAAHNGADLTCPLMTGIFFNIIAGCVEEQMAAGKKPTAPYWRVLSEKNVVSSKTPYGPDRQVELLRDEGHKVERSGEKWIVVNASR